MTDIPLLLSVNAFLNREAMLLDQRKWHDWLALYAPESRLWAPSWVGDEDMTTDPATQVSLIYADRVELEARIFRIESDDSYATTPLPHTVHLVNCTAAERTGDGLVTAQANWFVHYFWRTRGASVRAGRYEYTLREEDGAFSILLKKVLIHDDRVVGAIDIYNI